MKDRQRYGERRASAGFMDQLFKVAHRHRGSVFVGKAFLMQCTMTLHRKHGAKDAQKTNLHSKW